MAEVTKEDLNRAGYKYYAFISYNHRDEKWAKALQSRLRRYRLPSVARTELGGDIRIDPVFRYKTNLSVAPLREKIKEELDHSKCLIVICSPNSAKPNIKGEHWVNDEVKRFIALGRVNRIVPVIVDGIPNTGDERECFPPALRETEISAVELKRGTRLERRHEFLRLVAKLLDLEPAQLIKEDEEELRRERILRFLCWLPAILLGLAGAIFVWDALRPVENYYANYVDSYGLPEGIFPLSKDVLHGRHIHYRFEYRGVRFGRSIHADSAGRSFINLFGCQRVLRRVVQSNSAGRPREWSHTEYSDRSPILDFKYDTDGILRQIVCRAPNGAFRRRLVLSDGEGVMNGVIELKGEKPSQAVMESASITSSGMMGAGQTGRGDGASEIAQYQLKRDARGRTIERRFKDVMGYKFVSDSEGVYGFSYKLDGLGRTEELWHLDINGDRRENKKGVAGRKYHYVGRNMDRAEYVNASGTPTLGHVGWMVCVDEFDDFDNNTRSCYYDAEDKRMTCEDGYAEYRCEYDAYGNKTAIRCYGTDGKPCLTKEGIAEYRYEYDARGNMTAVRCYGTDGKRCVTKEGIAESCREYDVRGNITAERYYDVDGKPCLDKDGYAGLITEYDAHGREIRNVWIGVDGKPCLHKDGIAGWIMEYDVRGQVVRDVWIGVDCKPCLHKDGFAERRYDYDARGNRTAVRYFGVDCKPCLNNDGIAEYRCEYDAHGNETAVRYYGVDGMPCINYKDGVAECRCKYDAHGNKTAQRYYGVDGKPCNHKDGNAGWIAEYDAHGREIRNVWIGEDGKPVLVGAGYAEFRCEYDARGNETAVRFYGVDGKPCLNKNGFAECRVEYDGRGNMAARRFYGTDGKPVLKDGLYAACVWKHDDRNEVVETFFDEKMEPIQIISVTFSAEMFAGSSAAAAGVREGDVWCEYGDYRLRDDGDFRAIGVSLRENAQKKQRLVVARKDGARYKILSFDFPAGPMGIRVAEKQINSREFEKIQKAYREYLEKDK